MPTVRGRGLYGAGAIALVAATVIPALGSTIGAADAAAPDTTIAAAPDFTHHATPLGAAPAAQRISVSLWLNLRNQSGLEALATAVSTPGSARYGEYISAAQFHAAYSPTAATVSSVVHFLEAHHLKVVDIPGNNMYVTASGSVQDVEGAFGTTLENYRDGGTVRRAPTSDVKVPAALAGSVGAVVGLTTGGNTFRPDNVKADGARPDTAKAPGANLPGQPCSTYWAQQVATSLPSAYGEKLPFAPCGYAGAQLQGAYGTSGLLSHGVTGKGQTIAIVDAYAWPLMRSDANTYFTNHGLPTLKGEQYRELLPASFIDPSVNGCQTPDQWSGEEALDVESSHTMAPGANILYVGAQDCTDQSLIGALNSVIDGQKAHIISNSYGGVGDINQLDAATQEAYTHTFLQAVAQGIGVFFSSGDSGDEINDTGGFRTVDFPAADPWVTAVGGTSLAVGKENNYLFETGWSTGRSVLSANKESWTPAPPGAYYYGGGGGVSQVSEQPSYQKGVVPTSISEYFGPGTGIGGDTPGRAVPDIAMLGDPNTGFLFGQTVAFPDGSVKYAEGRIGGTSLASPLMAGLEALADQIKGAPHGFANPAIYQEYRTDKAAFHDITGLENLAVARTNFNNGVDDTQGVNFSLRSLGAGPPLATIFARRGYDDVTGVGTPNGVEFLTHLGSR